MKPIELNEITQLKFPTSNYFEEETSKNQIVLHHTVSGAGIEGDYNTWLNSTSKVGAHFIIDREGKCYQTISSKYWINCLGIKVDFLKSLNFTDYRTRNVLLNKHSINIELDNWGGLTKSNNKYFNAYNKEVKTEIAEYPKKFKDYIYYEKYTNKQIETTMRLIIYLSNKYNIPLDYNENMWNVSHDALAGKSGIWTHVSYRQDKSDCHPQEELINALKKLKDYRNE